MARPVWSGSGIARQSRNGTARFVTSRYVWLCRRNARQSCLGSARMVLSSRGNAGQSRSGIFRHVVARRLTQGSLGTARRGWLGYRNARQSGRVRSGLCLARQVGLAQRSQGAARMVMSGFGNARQSWSGPDGTACPGSVTQGSHGGAS